MAFNLAKTRIDSKLMNEGALVPLGPDYGDIKVRVRGLTDTYFDEQARLQNAAVKADPKVDTVEQLPTQVKRAINVKCLIDHVFLDVEGAEIDGTAVDAEGYKNLLRDPDFTPLVLATYKAAISVGAARAITVDELLGN